MLNQHANDYIQLRQLGGFKFTQQEMHVRSFVRFAYKRGDSHIRTDTAIEWAAQGTSADCRENRLRSIVAFARHCRIEDRSHELPPTHVFSSGRHKRPVAYTFSPDEIRQILAAALKLEPCASLRPLTYYTLFGLLASTGLRIGEAVRLRQDDITADGLLIRETKFKKNRIVPIHPTTASALNQHLSFRKQIGISSNQIFVGMNGQPLQQAWAQNAFRKVITAIGLDKARYGHCPRLHDLRHAWAVRALESTPTDVEQVDQHVRAVMTYLGHSSVAASYYYMHSTPIIMDRIANACAALEQGDIS
ncbi:tyrosine-type recombinase/integrase [Serratia nevei]|uniref:tyrosine-type recombinase/integrase n=1 Tax=Serratia nevei TaxID=2703794 RepID=UPI00313DE13A